MCVHPLLLSAEAKDVVIVKELFGYETTCYNEAYDMLGLLIESVQNQRRKY